MLQVCLLNHYVYTMCVGLRSKKSSRDGIDGVGGMARRNSLRRKIHLLLVRTRQTLTSLSLVKQVDLYLVYKACLKIYTMTGKGVLMLLLTRQEIQIRF